ncbi:MAG: hypothetical protein B6D77_04545 [gamma proteobacterium symbiont of Ctena orbiculata]|nr:MAG: hypothetical protein B6D77_04545 [gamma proteobacterium symbiont of Ctena orbiculata]
MFATLMIFLTPLSLTLSREGRGDVLGECDESFWSGRSNKLSVYHFPLIPAFPLPSRERARERGAKTTSAKRFPQLKTQH